MIVVLPDAVIPSSVLFAVGLVVALCISMVILIVTFVFHRLAAIGGEVVGWSGPSWVARFYCFWAYPGVSLVTAAVGVNVGVNVGCHAGS